MPFEWIGLKPVKHQDNCCDNSLLVKVKSVHQLQEPDMRIQGENNKQLGVEDCVHRRFVLSV